MSRDTRRRRSITRTPRRSSVVQPMASGLLWLFCLILAGSAMAATITVNTPFDQNPSAVDGLCSLREAVQAVITTTAQDGCIAGSPEGPPNSFAGRDTIDFALPAPAIITLSAALPVLDGIDDGVIISGPGSRFLTINGNNQFQVFRVGGAENVTIEGLTIANGRAPTNGGGILNSSGRLTVRNTRFTANTALENGGAISNEGVTATLVILSSTFSGNVAVDFPSQEEEGGAVVNVNGTATIANSTFFGNSVPNQGGAIFNSGNNDGTGILTIINSTINSNTGALGGGGVFSEKGGTIILRNTLLAGNPGGNCGTETGGVIVDEGGNLDDSTLCNFGANSLSSGVAGLDPLGVQNNGGPTDTVALTAASDAVDLGLNAVCADTPVSNLDQRGAARPTDGDGVNGATCDIGAFESDRVPPPPPAPPPPPPPTLPPSPPSSRPQVPCTRAACSVQLACIVILGSETRCIGRINVFVRARDVRFRDDASIKALLRIRFASGVANIAPGETPILNLKVTKRGRQIVRTSERRTLRGVFEIRNVGGLTNSRRVTLRLRRR